MTSAQPATAAFAALLVGTGLMYLLDLSRNGWGNSFYAGAAQAGASSWSAMFFGSSDAPSSITVDKPPAGLWPISLSIRLFGLSSWSVLVPEALMGVAAVALLTLTVRRVLGPWAGLLAGLLLAVTPVVTLIFRYDNPDALMTLLLVAAAYTATRAVEDGRTRWMVLTGTLLGAAFLTKSMQAFLVLPGLALVLLVATPGPIRRRIGRLVLGGVALLVSGGWWFLVVGLIPKGSRPWVGGSGTGDPLDLALGYNGLGRLVGQKSPSGRVTVKGGSPWRLLGSAGDQISWLIPAALIALVVAVILVRRAERTDPVRAAVLLWGGWAVVASVVLGLAQGIWHAYYTVELAPAYAALIAIAATLLWRRNTLRARITLAVASVLTTGWAVSLIGRHRPLINPVSIAVVVLGLAAVVLLLPAPVRTPPQSPCSRPWSARSHGRWRRSSARTRARRWRPVRGAARCWRPWARGPRRRPPRRRWRCSVPTRAPTPGRRPRSATSPTISSSPSAPRSCRSAVSPETTRHRASPPSRPTSPPAGSTGSWPGSPDRMLPPRSTPGCGRTPLGCRPERRRSTTCPGSAPADSRAPLSSRRPPPGRRRPSADHRRP
jgi:4-amino-4-deoxy-L-arabinose transferase-like glycosyltransferase